MRKLYVLLVTLFAGFIGHAQLTGTKNIPGDYADLAAAISALNTQGVGSGGVTLNLLAGNNQTAPAGGYVIGGSGTAILTTANSSNPVVIQGNANTVTASGSLTAGALNDGLFKIIGADWVTITGFTLQENAANTTTTAASNNMTEWGIALLYATTTDGAQNNTLQGNTITLNRTYANTFGIYSNSTHNATAVTTSVTATTTAGGNSGLKVYSNTVSNVNTGVVVVGPTAAADVNDGLDIGGTTATTGNSITNYGTTGTFSGYVNVSGTVNGILIRNTKNFNVSYNTVASSNGGVTSGTLRGIYVPSFSNAPTGTLTNTINYNAISVNTGLASGTLQGIVVEATTASATTSLSINNNSFSNTGYTAAGTGTLTLISNAMPVSTTNINNNTFNNLSVNTTGGVTFITNSVTRPAGAVCNVSNNAIVTGFAKTAAGGTVIFYTSNSTSPTTVTEINSGNNFSNVTVTGATTISGWGSTDGSTTTPFGPSKTITGNTFTNITGGTSTITILNVGYSNSGSTTNNVSGNLIGNVSGAGTVNGLTSAAGSQNFFSNTIYGLTTTGTSSTVSGQVVSGGAVQNVYKTKIYDLQSSGASGSVNGLLVSSGTTVNVYNNVIGDLRTPAANAANPLAGLNITGGTTVNAYFNTVYLNASSTGALFGSSAVSASTTLALTLSNNIFVNLSTPAGATGYSSAYRRSGTTLTSYNNASNNNLFYAGTPGTNNLLFYDGTNADQTLAAYKTRVSPRDAASISENPPFASTTGSATNFLHLTAGTTTAIESGGANISGITDDYDGQTRAGNAGYTGTGSAPDIGADEFEGVSTGTPCVAPADQATALTFGTATAATQPGSFTAAGSNPTGYLVVRSTGTLNANPVNGTAYAAGSVIGNGIVVQSGNAMSFTASGLTSNTSYTYTVFSYNASGCIGGPVYNAALPLNGSSTTCPATPASLNTSNVIANGFRINFTSTKGGGASAVTYNLEVATDAAFTNPIAGSPFTITDTTTNQTTLSFTVSGLNASTTYYYRLKANGCNTAAVTGNVTTACAAVTLPLNESFNGTALPACWVGQFVSGSKAFQVGDATTAAGTLPNPAAFEGTGRLLFTSYSSSGSQTRLVSPPFDATGTPGVDVNFSWYHSNNGGATSYLTEGVQVQYSTDGVVWTNAGSLIRRYDAVTGWANKSVALPAGAANQPFLFVGFLFTSNAGYDSYLDALSVVPGSSCQPPTALQATSTTVSAGISWTAPASAPSSGYQWEIRSSGAAGSGSTGLISSNSTAAGVTSDNATGLTPGTVYTLYVRSNCGSEYSSWAAYTFNTLIVNDDAAGAAVLIVGSGCTSSPYTNVGAAQGANEKFASCYQSATTGTGTTIATHTVWFKFVAPASGAVRVTTDITGGTLSDTHLALFGATDPNDYSTFNILSCDDDNGGSTNSTRSTLYATGLTNGQTYYVSVDGYNGATGTFCVAVDQLDNTMLATANTCTSGYQTPSGTQSTYTGWVTLVDNSGKLVALVRNAAGGSVNSYSTSQNVSATQRQNAGIYYLNRNYLINNSTATNVQVQFFFTDAELAALNAADGTTLSTLGVTRQTGSTCQNNFATANGTSSFLAQTGNGSVGGASWIQVTTPSFSNFYLNKAGAVLPANLLTFSGSRQGNANVLKWTVAQERDVQAYQVERSEDGRAWKAVGSVNGLGNTSAQRSYGFTDGNVSGLKQYYRLRQVDASGAAKLSSTILISGAKSSVLTLIGLFPNPAVSKLNVLVDAPAKDNVTLLVMDAVGRIVKTQKAGVDAGSNNVELNVTGLATGSYLVKVTCESNCQTATAKFTKE